jgi:hypothetical protein
MNNIVVIGIAGSGINFLKNIFLLSNKFRLEVPMVGLVNDRFSFMKKYYESLVESIHRNEKWLDHEWKLRMTHFWTDEINQNYELINIHTENPTVFSMHYEKYILVDDPITVVLIEMDDPQTCELLYRLKSENHSHNNPEPSTIAHHPNRKYYAILFSDVLRNPTKIFELTEHFGLEIKKNEIDIIHNLWQTANNSLIKE